MDGSYKADGRFVRRAPTQTESGLKMGFVVCKVSKHLTDGAAQEIADALNLHRQMNPEKH